MSAPAIVAKRTYSVNDKEPSPSISNSSKAHTACAAERNGGPYELDRAGGRERGERRDEGGVGGRRGVGRCDGDEEGAWPGGRGGGRLALRHHAKLLSARVDKAEPRSLREERKKLVNFGSLESRNTADAADLRAHTPHPFVAILLLLGLLLAVIFQRPTTTAPSPTRTGSPSLRALDDEVDEGRVGGGGLPDDDDAHFHFVEVEVAGALARRRARTARARRAAGSGADESGDAGSGEAGTARACACGGATTTRARARRLRRRACDDDDDLSCAR